MVEDEPLKVLHPVLYAICNDKNVTVEFVCGRQLNLNFRRWLYPELKSQRDKICNRVAQYNFQNDDDEVLWKWGKDRKFSVKTIYNVLAAGTTDFSCKHIWKSRIPPKIKIFLVFIVKGVTLTRDNMVRRNWKGDHTCSFCDELETINHLFFLDAQLPKWFGR